MTDLGELDVLVVDDQEMMRDLLARVLKDAGVGKVREAEGGEAALTLLRDAPTDLIFADHSMDGWPNFHSGGARRTDAWQSPHHHD